MIRLVHIMFFSLLVGCWFGVSSAQMLNIGTAEWRPWQIVEEGRLTGITSDILHELARRTGYGMNIRPLPHKRLMIEFENQTIDMEPTVNPLWRENQRSISVYTTPYYITCDIIIVGKDSGIKGKSVHDFEGLSLGCGLGYYYPEGFQEAFENGEIHREDNPVSEKNLLKLALKRIDGIIVDKIQSKYLFKKSGVNPDDFEIAYQFQPSKLSLRLHKHKQDLLPTLNSALEKMKSEGTIERIVSKYAE